MTRNPEADRLLARTLFTPAEAALEYSEGFRGHPDLGVLFFSGLLGGLELKSPFMYRPTLRHLVMRSGLQTIDVIDG